MHLPIDFTIFIDVREIINQIPVKRGYEIVLAVYTLKNGAVHEDSKTKKNVPTNYFFQGYPKIPPGDDFRKLHSKFH